MARSGEAAARAGLEVAVSVADPGWEEALPRCRDVARRAARAAAPDAAAGGPAEISILLAGDARVGELNRAHRGFDAPTNVLAFASGTSPPAPGAARLLGDVVVALGVARREAEAGDLELSHHLSHLVVHGVLHLLGYDHDTEDGAETMERREAAVLAGLGIADPHAGLRGEDGRPKREP